MVNKHRRDVEENRGARLAFSFDVFTTLHIEQGARGNVIFQFVEFRQRDKSWHCREEEEEEEEIKETGWISFGLSLLKGGRGEEAKEERNCERRRNGRWKREWRRNGRQLVDRFIILERCSRTTCKVCRTDSGHPAERNNHITHGRGAFASHPLDTALATAPPRILTRDSYSPPRISSV